MRTLALVAVAIVLLVIGVASAPSACTNISARGGDARARLMLERPRGHITSGSVLGVEVGATERSADAAIRRLFTPSYVLRDGADGLSRLPLPPGDAVVSYRDKSWRNGVVSLLLKDGRVIAVAWSYSGPLYIDL
jgi:hypothetical protein